MSRYQSIWIALRETGKAEVTATTESAQLVIWGVRKAKYLENKLRAEVGLPKHGKTNIIIEKLSSTQVKIKFELCYSGSL